MEKQRYVRCRLKKKLRLLNIESEELLQRCNGSIAATERDGCNAVNYSSNDKKKEDKSDVNIMFESEAHTERGSPSLVGRGIANPMSERTRGFEMSEDSPS
jgi:hypothetical protein